MNERKCKECNIHLMFCYPTEEETPDGFLILPPKNEEERKQSTWWLSALDDADYTETREMCKSDVGGINFKFCKGCQDFMDKENVVFIAKTCIECGEYEDECKCKEVPLSSQD